MGRNGVAYFCDACYFLRNCFAGNGTAAVGVSDVVTSLNRVLLIGKFLFESFKVVTCHARYVRSNAVANIVSSTLSSL